MAGHSNTRCLSCRLHLWSHALGSRDSYSGFLEPCSFLLDLVGFCQMQPARAARSLKSWPLFPVAFDMKLTEENKLHFLQWLVDNHASELKKHIEENTNDEWWWPKQGLRCPFPQGTCAIMSTWWISKKLVEWSQLPAGAEVGDLDGDCPSKKAVTTYIRQALSVDAVIDLHHVVVRPKMPLPASPLSAFQGQSVHRCQALEGPGQADARWPYVRVLPGRAGQRGRLPGGFQEGSGGR